MDISDTDCNSVMSIVELWMKNIAVKRAEASAKSQTEGIPHQLWHNYNPMFPDSRPYTTADNQFKMGMRRRVDVTGKVKLRPYIERLNRPGDGSSFSTATSWQLFEDGTGKPKMLLLLQDRDVTGPMLEFPAGKTESPKDGNPGHASSVITALVESEEETGFKPSLPGVDRVLLWGLRGLDGEEGSVMKDAGLGPQEDAPYILGYTLDYPLNNSNLPTRNEQTDSEIMQNLNCLVFEPKDLPNIVAGCVSAGIKISAPVAHALQMMKFMQYAHLTDNNALPHLNIPKGAVDDRNGTSEDAVMRKVLACSAALR